ncbi:MAG: hypothetical protein BWK76_14035 [Desulfobulbaceae bacterium A2]|nr:MAG: hypothetical protein BWK76_14035 [Desulfobulbaceae bacterium A2]
MKFFLCLIALLLVAALPAHAQESDRVRQIEQELQQLRNTMTQQEQRVKALEQQMQGIDPEQKTPATHSGSSQTAPSQGD